MHQTGFVLAKLALFNIDISITSTVIIIWFAALLVFLAFFIASKHPKLVPSHFQGALEVILEFIEDTTGDVLGEKGKIWFPFLITLFSFILFCNLLGMFPGFTSPTSEINVTATLAIIVFLVVQTYGIIHNGPSKYFGHFLVPGIPWYIVPFLLFIEILTQFAKPFSLAVRLFANLFAGHTALIVIISIIFMLKNMFLYPIPIVGYLLVALFEIFMAFIQAFIFTFLTGFYLSETLLEHQTK